MYDDSQWSRAVAAVPLTLVEIIRQETRFDLIVVNEQSIPSPFEQVVFNSVYLALARKARGSLKQVVDCCYPVELSCVRARVAVAFPGYFAVAFAFVDVPVPGVLRQLSVGALPHSGEFLRACSRPTRLWAPP